MLVSDQKNDKILIFEDDLIIAQKMKDCLQSFGYGQVKLAKSYKDTINIVKVFLAYLYKGGIKYLQSIYQFLGQQLSIDSDYGQVLLAYRDNRPPSAKVKSGNEKITNNTDSDPKDIKLIGLLKEQLTH